MKKFSKIFNCAVLALAVSGVSGCASYKERSRWENYSKAPASTQANIYKHSF